MSSLTQEEQMRTKCRLKSAIERDLQGDVCRWEDNDKGTLDKYSVQINSI
jgi:hypothetical protein